MLNVLMLRYSGGFEHSYLPHAEVAIKEIGKASGLYKAVTTHRCDRINPKVLATVDVLVFATTGELPFDDSQKALLLDFVRGGKGFVGVHNATDTFYQWPEYGEMIGGYFAAHPWTQEVRIKVEDPNHPATRMLPPVFTVYDEIYTFKNWDRAKTHVLMSLDTTSVDLSKGNREDQDYAMAWCHPYGQGRVIYTALGHPDDLWGEPWFREHILGCIQWAGRLAD
ncbi:MAG: ThuA domain-containing protein [Armatimonadota bacterium]|nr:ThuA domain-containing protein [Armatimonadota bacterium]